ncbi:uncharacterized protein DS421_7g210610 [Arachis hypogaea]|nr:uncharacterized protein DS421_7g210610 [Arachis hypogaea]
MELDEMEHAKDDFDVNDYGEEDEKEQGEEEEDGEERTIEEDQSGWNNDEMEQLEIQMSQIRLDANVCLSYIWVEIPI